MGENIGTAEAVHFRTPDHTRATSKLVTAGFLLRRLAKEGNSCREQSELSRMSIFQSHLQG